MNRDVLIELQTESSKKLKNLELINIKLLNLQHSGIIEMGSEHHKTLIAIKGLLADFHNFCMNVMQKSANYLAEDILNKEGENQ